MLAMPMLAACSEGAGGDFCRNHSEFHADHLDTVADLGIVISATGVIDGRLSIPRSVVDGMDESDVRTLLGSAGKTLVLQPDTSCVFAMARVDASEDGFDATYTANCDANYRLRRIDVKLFDYLERLEEVVTSVTTPATAKRFAISRECDSPIFRLD